MEHYHVGEDKITTIYNPIVIKKEDIVPFEELQKKYDIEEQNFYYTVPDDTT